MNALAAEPNKSVLDIAGMTPSRDPLVPIAAAG
jgi:hypothetical protein